MTLGEITISIILGVIAFLLWMLYAMFKKALEHIATILMKYARENSAHNDSMLTTLITISSNIFDLKINKNE